MVPGADTRLGARRPRRPLQRASPRVRHVVPRAVLPALIDMTRRDPRLADAPPAFIAERRAPSRAGPSRRASPEASYRARLDVDALIDRIAGPVFYRHLVVQEPMAAAEVERLVDDVLSRRLPSNTRSLTTLRRAAGLHGDAVEAVGGLHRALLVAHDDQLRLLAELGDAGRGSGAG